MRRFSDDPSHLLVNGSASQVGVSLTPFKGKRLNRSISYITRLCFSHGFRHSEPPLCLLQLDLPMLNANLTLVDELGLIGFQTL